MIKNEVFFETLRENGVSFFCGVPDSLLKNFCAYLTDNISPQEHIITANEGGAIALASGYHLATGKIPMVYLQNSGLGNTVNPILSLADNEVYGIPMIILIGWRGEPGVKDEPQHVKQGRVQNDLLDAMEIPYFILDSDTEDIAELTQKALLQATNNNAPVALVVRKDAFEPYSLKNEESVYELSRERAIQCILNHLSTDDIVISTTGKPSREVYEYRVEQGFGHQNDFLTVGSMGHCSQIALGVALNTRRNVYCLDGDGSVIMHMGGLGIIGNLDPSNLKHIILNNGAHDSVGGQPSIGFYISFTKIALASGYKKAYCVSTEEDLNRVLVDFVEEEGPSLLEIRTNKGARKDLGRPATTPIKNKEKLMEELRV